LVGFDDIALGLITVARCVTLEGWTEVLYLLSEAVDSPVMVNLFFLTLVFFGGYCLC
jgi:hypothetical protein